MRRFDFLDEYSLFVSVDSSDAVIGHIHHVRRNSAGGSLEVPVAYFYAFVPSLEEGAHKHYAVHLFIRSTVRYDATTRTTTVVTSPERQAGSNRELLQRLRNLAASDLPPCRPDMPGEFARTLLANTSCTEPMFLSVYHATEVDGQEFGEVLDLD